MSDTPITDAADGACGVSSTVARNLERQRNALAISLHDVMTWIDNWNPDFTLDGEWDETERKAKLALKSLHS